MATQAAITTRLALVPPVAALMVRPVGPFPLAQPIGTGWMPVIYHSARAAEYLRFERFPRKTKPTAVEALTYATRALWYRQRRAADKRRRIEAMTHSPFALQAAE